MLRKLVFAVLLLLSGAAWGQTAIGNLQTQNNLSEIAAGGSVTQALARSNLGISAGAVANNAALKNITNAVAGASVIRQGYAVSGDGGDALYTFTDTACTLNSGAGDNGSQVKPNAGGGCWVAAFGPAGADIRVFGADPTGVADSQPAVLAAQVAGKIVVPCGTFLLAEALTSTVDDFGGQSSACSILKTTFATGDAITLSTAHATFHDMQFSSSVTRTGGSYLTMNSIWQNVQRVVTYGAAIGVHATGLSSVGIIRDFVGVDTVDHGTYSKSTCILVDQANNTHSPEALIIDNPYCADQFTTNVPRSSIEIQSSDALMLLHPNLIGGQSALLIDPPNTGGAAIDVSSMQIIGGYLDSATLHDLELTTTGNSQINRLTATGTWFGDSGGDGIYFNAGSSSGVAAGFYCVNCYGVNNATWFANMATQYWSNIQFIGGCSSNNGNGNFVGAASVGFIQIQGFNHNTTACAGTPSPIGIQIGSNDSNWRISENNLVGVATPISGAANLLSGRIEDNPGYNPLGNVSVTVPASGSTLYNGPSPSTLFVSGGTVNSIVLNGTATGQTFGAFPLAPFQGIAVTYSVAPSMTISVQ